jgi:hypothetical protein
MQLILVITDHICKTGAKVRVSKGAVFEFQLEARIERNNESGFPTYKQQQMSTNNRVNRN